MGSELLATSDRALRLDETGLPARYYVLKDDARMDLLRPTTYQTTCPFKGSRLVLVGDGGRRDVRRHRVGVRDPIEAAADIAGYLSFYPDRTVITVEGQSVAA